MRVVWLLGIVLVITGCKTLDSDRAVTPLATPAQWSQTADSGNPLDPEVWVDDFEDEILADLIRRGLRQNHDLRASMGRVRRSLAIADAARARRRPSLDATLGLSRLMRNNPDSGRISDARSSRIDLGLDASWEADVWSRLAQEAQAADLDAAALRSDLQMARLSLAVNVARIYCDAVTSRHLQKLFTDTQASFERTLGVVEERFKRGITNAVDVHLARANVAAAESTKEQAAGDVDFSLRLLEVLVGQYPAAAVKTAEALPAVAAIPAGLPSTLLERRPDLRAARQRADADLKQLDASRKQWLPAFRLTANGGTSSEQLSNVLNAEHLVWSLAANATQPIFDGDRIAADIAVSEAELDTSVAEYHSTILDAFREVETALAADGYLGRQLAALERAADESTKAEAQALERYQQGLDDITSVLVAQRRSVDAQRNVIRTRNAVLQNRLDLCLALGGDFGDD